jgi:hypothetical protein
VPRDERLACRVIDLGLEPDGPVLSDLNRLS